MAAAAKRIARVSAHNLIMRGRREIISKVGQRNFANVFSELGWFGAGRGIDSVRGRVGKQMVEVGSRDPTLGARTRAPRVGHP